ncbi:MAG TPA: hypothetical protein VMH50_05515 [Thermoleophilia bacterium]|nr:hypothetical protein [Thermoleophilia bacterium]
MRLAGRLIATVLSVIVAAVAVYGCVRATEWLRDRDAFGLLQREPDQPVRLTTIDPYTREVAGKHWFGDYFVTMVLSPGTGSDAHPRIVTRWERRKVTVALLDDGGPGVRSYVHLLLRRLDRLQDQVDFKLGAAHPLITIELLDHATYVRENDADSVGDTKTRYYAGAAGLISASISVDVGVQDTPDAVKSTLIHELTHAIGASGHFFSPSDRRHSVMYKANTLTTWSQNDAAVIRVLYSPFIRSGMSEAAARAGLRKYARAGK